MNASELQALRRLLFYSAAEAARYLAADELRPQGVEERTWNRWEAGKMPVPDNIARKVREVLTYRQSWIDTYIQSARLATPQAPLVLLWYEDRDDWPHKPELWRPHLSAVADMVAQAEPGACRLAAFDARAFLEWRQANGRADDADSWKAWAATVAV